MLTGSSLRVVAVIVGGAVSALTGLVIGAWVAGFPKSAVYPLAMGAALIPAAFMRVTSHLISPMWGLTLLPASTTFVVASRLLGVVAQTPIARVWDVVTSLGVAAIGIVLVLRELRRVAPHVASATAEYRSMVCDVTQWIAVAVVVVAVWELIGSRLESRAASVVVLVMGGVAVVARCLVAIATLRLAERYASPLPAHVRLAQRSIERSMTVVLPPVLYLPGFGDSRMPIGLLTPAPGVVRLVMSSKAVEALTSEQLEAVLAHEACHIKCRHHLWLHLWDMPGSIGAATIATVSAMSIVPAAYWYVALPATGLLVTQAWRTLGSAAKRRFEQSANARLSRLGYGVPFGDALQLLSEVGRTCEGGSAFVQHEPTPTAGHGPSV